MKEYIKFTPPSKKRTIWTCIFSAIFILCIYIAVFQLYHYKKENYYSILITFSAVSLTYLQKLWIDTSSKMNWIKHLFPIITFIILGLTVLAAGKLQKAYYTQQLADNGQTANGKVLIVRSPEFDLYYDHYALVQYKFNNKIFLQKIDNKKQKLIQGDSITLRISTQHPEIVEAVY